MFVSLLPGSLKSLASLLQRRGFLYSTVTPRTGLSGFLPHCNTRYGWVVSPYPTGTFTLQETPSFAWRTNTPPQPPKRHKQDYKHRLKPSLPSRAHAPRAKRGRLLAVVGQVLT